MSGNENSGDGEFDDVINAEDILHVIELDDNRDISEVMEEADLGEDFDDDMEASGGQIEVQDMAGVVFDKHKDAVFSVHIDPNTSQLAVTGGQDDTAFVWKISTGEVLFECTGHKESVTCTSFSHDGTYVATADLSGLVKVWKIETKEDVFTFECSDAEWMKWHPGSHVLFLGTVDGDIWMWKIPSGECKTLQSHGCTVSCGVILSDGKRMCVGYDDGSLKIWDLKSVSVQHNITGVNAHKSTVLCVDTHPVNNVILSGSTDVTARAYNSSTGKLLGSYDCSSPETEEDSVEAVALSPTHSYAATGTVAGVLSIWDTNTQICRHKCRHEGGIVSVQWDRLTPQVYTSCLDGAIRLWDARNGEMVSKWTGHTDSILGFDVSRDGKYLVTVSEDKTARVFSLSTSDR
ncbi:angio-associated migratory cell protein-like [Mya arenaria]|uniref:angio-associated migratory cell protein-like n=1 Tax=Mya arenaria TaxID=6604 RepID=UPI0022E93D1D|nr:angio-associated migratory cell protein-like [Mya arenaria]